MKQEKPDRAVHEKFHYRSAEELKKTAEMLSVEIPLAGDTQALRRKAEIGGIELPNRMGIAPMEGADALPDGAPSEMTCARYLRYAEGGCGMIWFEAVSIVPEGRSSPHQLMLTEKNVDEYRKLNDRVREAGLKKNGYAPYLVMQANHSGRYANPGGKPAPMIAYRHPYYEKLRAATDECIVGDDYLKGLEEEFGKATEKARRAGFDAVDIKACHGYLLMELLSAYHRNGPYGGSFENRTRLLRNGIRAAKAFETKDFSVTARIGIHDGYAWPWGFGVKEGGDETPDMTEPILLIRQLYEEEHIAFVNLTMGNPYVTTHVTRPFDSGKYVPREHPLVGIARIIGGIGEVKRAVPGLFVSASGPSYLRQWADLYAAGAIENGLCDHMLFGRMAFANPDFANQIRQNGRMDASRVCLACGKCGDLIRAGLPTGCVVRNSGNYLPYYRTFQQTDQ